MVGKTTSVEKTRRSEKFHTRGAPYGSARKPQTTDESSRSSQFGAFESVYNDKDIGFELAWAEAENSRVAPSSSSSGYSRPKNLANKNQLNIATGSVHGEELSSAPKSVIKSSRSLSSMRGTSSSREQTSTMLGISGQKNLLHSETLADTSSDETSASDAERKDTVKSSTIYSSRCIVIVSIVVLLVIGVAGGIVYYITIYDNEEHSANLVGTPTLSPKDAHSQPEVTPSIPKTNSDPTTPPSFPPSPRLPEVPTTPTEVTTPSFQGSFLPTSPPSLLATLSPTLPISRTPVFPKIELGGGKEQVTTFYAIGDVPYSPQQAEEIEVQIKNIPFDAEFVIHVGDLRNYDEANPLCREEEYVLAADIFKQSPVPVFVIVGDNEWIDCSNPEEGMQFWNKHFLGFDSRYWNHTFDVVRQPGRAYNFAFVHKKTLFIGLNIIGLPVHDSLEWESRLTEQVQWTKELIRYYSSTIGETGRVVIFGHANPGSAHYHYFHPLNQFISDELNNEIPILYLNGDKHEWSYDPAFQGQESLLRIMVTGGSSEPPLQIQVVADGDMTNTNRAFMYDRGL